jgi:hypothetical protein
MIPINAQVQMNLASTHQKYLPLHVTRYGNAQVSDDNVLLHKHAQWVVRVLAKWSSALISGGGIQSERLRLVRPSFEPKPFTAAADGMRFEQSQKALGDALPSASRADIHALQFANFRIEDNRTTADRPARIIPRNRKHDIRSLQRSQIQAVPAFRRVQGVLVNVQLSNEGDHFRLIG